MEEVGLIFFYEIYPSTLCFVQIFLMLISFLAVLFVTPVWSRAAANENASTIVSLTITNANVGQPIPSTIHGVILETNINRGDDGGLYAELIYNRAFQGETFLILHDCHTNDDIFILFREEPITRWMVIVR